VSTAKRSVSSRAGVNVGLNATATTGGEATRGLNGFGQRVRRDGEQVAAVSAVFAAGCNQVRAVYRRRRRSGVLSLAPGKVGRTARLRRQSGSARAHPRGIGDRAGCHRRGGAVIRKGVAVTGGYLGRIP
jgi:hypothetical protein